MKLRLSVEILSLAILELVLGGMGQARAGTLDTVNWAPDSTVDGTGTGTLAGSISVTYSTGIGFNAGVTFTEHWASYLGTAGATSGAVTNELGGVLGGGPNGTPQQITFSSSVTQPILLVNFLGGPSGVFAHDVFNFGSNSFTLLSSHNATASGNMVSGTSLDTDTADDGFGIQFTGTFGPLNPLQFTYTSDGLGGNGLQSVAFTIGASQVPEPAALTLLAIGIACVAGYGWRRRLGTAWIRKAAQ
jgi:hypothetical protein